MGHITRYLGSGLQHIFLGGHSSIPSNPMNAWGIKQIFSGLHWIYHGQIISPSWVSCVCYMLLQNELPWTHVTVSVGPKSKWTWLGLLIWVSESCSARLHSHLDTCLTKNLLPNSLRWLKFVFWFFFWGYKTEHSVPAGGHFQLAEATFST